MPQECLTVTQIVQEAPSGASDSDNERVPDPAYKFVLFWSPYLFLPSYHISFPLSPNLWEQLHMEREQHKLKCQKYEQELEDKDKKIKALEAQLELAQK